MELTDLGGGVHRVTHALPWALDHVHCYAIEDRAGWTIVDAGLDTAETRPAWTAALAELGRPSVRRVVITHYHPDHIGASAALVELTGATEVVQGELDAWMTERVWTGAQAPGALTEYLAGHGMPLEAASRSSREEATQGVRVAVPTRRVVEGDELDLGGETFRVLVLPGHADGHIALFGERTGRLFGGDVILEEITPNVGRWEDTQPDPLGRYLATLARLAELRPVLVYPGHRRVIEDVPGRAAEIAEHHAERLAAIEGVLDDRAMSSWDVSLRIWGNGLGFHERRFALVEAVSHLERLEAEGRAEQVEPGLWSAAL